MKYTQLTLLHNIELLDKQQRQTVGINIGIFPIWQPQQQPLNPKKKEKNTQSEQHERNVESLAAAEHANNEFFW